MDYPNRSATHVTETKSWKLFNKVVPDHWIVRNPSAQDYGIDAHLELVSASGEVRGDICFVQLKGIDKGELRWKERDQLKYFDFTGISITTVRYWMNLPVAVFLFAADINEDRVWFASVKDQVRRRYDEFLSQKTFTFELFEKNEMGTEEGLCRFVAKYILERGHERFKTDLVSLLFGSQRFADFLGSHFGLDVFLTLEPEDLLTLSQMLATCEYVALPLGVDWNVKSFHDLCLEDQQQWREPGEIHELTIAKYVPAIASAMSEVLISARKHVTESHKHYWRHHHFQLFRSFAYGQVTYALEELDEIRKAAERHKKT